VGGAISLADHFFDLLVGEVLADLVSNFSEVLETDLARFVFETIINKLKLG